MIDVIVSDSCEYCSDQVSEMENNFDSSEYRLIAYGSREFMEYENRDLVDALPYIVFVRDSGGVGWSGKGFHEAAEIRKRSASKPFNLKTSRTRRG